MEQGQRLFRFWFNGGRVKERLERIDREALVKNEKPFVVPFFPSGKGKKPNRLAVLSDGVVQITAIKRAQNNNDLIIRLFEPTGKSRTTVLSLPFMNKKIPVALGGFEIRTLRVKLGTGEVMNTNLLEKPM
jgi:alpha-mannosidase